jgi:uncharacterized protein YukE
MSTNYIGASEENVEQAVLVQSDTEEFEIELLALLGTGDALAAEWQSESSTTFQELWQTLRGNLEQAIVNLHEFNGATIDNIEGVLDTDRVLASGFNVDGAIDWGG